MIVLVCVLNLGSFNGSYVLNVTLPIFTAQLERSPLPNTKVTLLPN